LLLTKLSITEPPGVKRLLRTIVAALLPAHGSAFAVEPNSADRLDLLVVAPHSDDEAIGCAVVILRAVAEQRRPGVVILTAGDGFPKAAAAVAKKSIDQVRPDDFLALAALRQRHSIEAMRRLGVREQDLFFLGYPDGGLASMYDARADAPYRQPFTGRTETYGPIVADYHRRTHGRPAPYLRQSAIDDLAEIMHARQPRAIYVTGEDDQHADHRFAGRYVCEAARAVNYQGELWSYVVHGEPPSSSPDLRVTLTDREFQFKRSLLESYEVGVSPVHDKLAETYTLPEERFWKLSPTRDARK
jgi:LmbE family N-acetylglucosaminyl deacetylase